MAVNFPQETMIEFLAVMAAIFTIFLVSKYHKSAEVKYLIFLVIFAAIWAFAYGMEFAVTKFESKILWAQFSYIGIGFLPVSYFCFASSFSNKINKLNRLNLQLFSIVPLITIILVFTNKYHHLIWTDIQLDVSRNIVIYKYGLWFYIFWI
ncbi:MAG: histidine kinase N-terminal 7TM domain-containing protein, partial [Prolixibacteraceae bacterium]|nr:histidine kinase N-terminal 7TM domain-containing protein [Prolixibacteraceae bacterium]